jgi:hypothetical protein
LAGLVGWVGSHSNHFMTDLFLFVGEIFLTIPWTNLYSAPCYISIENVYLIAVPVKGKNNVN